MFYNVVYVFSKRLTTSTAVLYARFWPAIYPFHIINLNDDNLCLPLRN